MSFEIYTYFGRVLKTFDVPASQTHHKTADLARAYLLKFEKETGQSAWFRIKCGAL